MCLGSARRGLQALKRGAPTGGPQPGFRQDVDHGLAAAQHGQDDTVEELDSHHHAALGNPVVPRVGAGQSPRPRGMGPTRAQPVNGKRGFGVYPHHRLARVVVAWLRDEPVRGCGGIARAQGAAWGALADTVDRIVAVGTAQQRGGATGQLPVGVEHHEQRGAFVDDGKRADPGGQPARALVLQVAGRSALWMLACRASMSTGLTK